LNSTKELLMGNDVLSLVKQPAQCPIARAHI